MIIETCDLEKVNVGKDHRVSPILKDASRSSLKIVSIECKVDFNTDIQACKFEGNYPMAGP